MSEVKRKRCPNCKKDRVETTGNDAQGGALQQVCVNCGAVVEDGCLEASYAAQLASSNEFRGYARSLPQTYVQVNSKKMPRCLKTSRHMIKTLVSQLNLSDTMKEQCIYLFEKMYYNSKYILSNERSKLLMAIATVYIVCLQNKWPISADYMAKLTHFNASEVIQMKKTIVTEENLTIDYVDLSELVEPLVHKAGLDNECCRLTQEILIVCKKSWLTVGRNPVVFINVAMFLAWKSLDILNLLNKSFVDFARSHNIKTTRAHKIHLSEILDIFLILAKELPWTDEELSIKTVPEHIPDICKFKQSLFKSALFAASEDTEFKQENSMPQDTNVSYVNPKKRKLEIFDPPAFKSTRPTNDRTVAPVIYDGDLNSEDLSESDIPDKDLCNYIKSKEEVVSSQLHLAVFDNQN